MCLMLGAGALAAVQFAIGAASTVAGFMGQQQQYEAQKDMYKENAKNANKAAIDQYAFSQLRWQQERAAAGQEKFNTEIDAAQARSTALAAAEEGGVAGLSPDMVLASYYATQGRYTDAVDNNYQMSRDSIFYGMDQTRNQAQSQINSMPKPVKPSFLDAAIRIAGSAFDAGTTYNQQRTVMYG